MRARYLSPFLCLVLAACGFSAPEPKRTPPPPPPPVPLSTLTATFTAKASDIAALLNAKMKSQIAHVQNSKVGCAIAKCRLDMVAKRNGEITASVAGQSIAVSLPFKLSADLALKSRLFKTTAHSDAAGTLNTETSFRLGPDWHLQPSTQGTVNLSKGVLKIGPLSMTVTDLWNANQDQLSAPLFRAIDREIGSAIKVKPQAQRLWHKAFEPIRVSKRTPAWLVLAPQHLRIGTMQAQGDAVVLTLGLDVRAHVVVGNKPETPVKTPPLPAPLPLANVPANTFRFSVPVLLPYSEAERLAFQRLRDHPVSLSGERIKFSALHILPSGQDVIVATRFCVSQPFDPFGWFDSCGTGYLRGKPEFDPGTQTIRIADLHYDIATADALVAAMHFLAGNALAPMLQDKLVFRVGPDLQKLEGEIKDALAKPQTRGVSITGQVQSFGTPALTWTKDGFLASFSATGTVQADLNLKD